MTLQERVLLAAVSGLSVWPGTVNGIAFVVSTLLSLGMTAWAVTLVRKARHIRGGMA